MKRDHRKVAVLGFHDGSAGQVETWFEKATGLRIACFIFESENPLAVDVVAENRKRVSQRTEFPKGTTFKGRPLIVTMDWVNFLRKKGIRKVLVLTPQNSVRFRQVQICMNEGFKLVSAIHPSVLVLPGADIKPGVWINAGTIIGYKAEVETGVIMNTGVQIDHHNILKRGCQVDPGVVLAGNVTLRERCHVHTGATIINRIEIGEDAIIGAGAVVIANVPPRTTSVGVPSRVIKYG